MIFHLVLFKPRPEVDDAKLEWMMRQTRSQLLKISGVLSVRCGKRVEPGSEWSFFLSVEVDSLDKLRLYASDPVHLKFVEEVIKPNVTDRLALDYEMEPGRNVKYS
jgi:hypothetical protein